MVLIDNGNYNYDFCINLVNYLSEKKQVLTYKTSMGEEPTREIVAGKRYIGVSSFPSIDVQPGRSQVDSRGSSGQLLIQLSATIFYYTYNLTAPLSELDNTLYGDKLFNLLEDKQTVNFFRSPAQGKSVPYLIRLWVDEVEPVIFNQVDGLFMGGSLVVYGLKEIFKS
jgi:hypothetical protein